MSRTTLFVVIGSLLSACLLILWRGSASVGVAQAEGPVSQRPGDVSTTESEQLQEQIKKLQDLVPDQAAVMSHLSYHFGNLWFAADEENWALAEFYLSETRSNLKWAARVKPVRKDPEGKETVDIVKIAEAVENGPFTQMKKAIADQDKKAFVKVYHDTLSACYACHKASFKPYLRPQVPKAPEARVINFDPKAKEPQ